MYGKLPKQTATETVKNTVQKKETETSPNTLTHSLSVVQRQGDDEYNKNIMNLGKGGRKSHYKKNASDPTTATVNKLQKTQRQPKTIARHLERLRAGDGEVVGTEQGGAGKITIVRLKSRKPGNTNHIYGIKHPGGDGRSAFHPRTPENGGEYDSDSDDEDA